MTIYFTICCDTSVTPVELVVLFIGVKPFSFNTLFRIFKSNILDRSGFDFPRNPTLKASSADL